MIYILDTANLEDIKHANEFYPIAGVTTNPSLVSKEKKDFVELVTSIRNIIGEEKMLHVQTTATKAEEMVKEAKMLKELVGGEFYVKIPIGEEGLKATMMLKKEGIGVTMTAIFTPQQALIAAKAGADFVAPYVNRLDNISADGVQVVADIVHMFDVFGLDTKVLAASFKNTMQLHNVALVGGHSATVSMDVLKAAIAHPMTDAAINGFEKDWKATYGEKSVKDLI
ncbi:MAG: fructose-6-phosphate aldolase [Clostridia bacterium]|nr:fructose-6-phosphate aldolase [Clostridia bacterium]